MLPIYNRVTAQRQKVVLLISGLLTPYVQKARLFEKKNSLTLSGAYPTYDDEYINLSIRDYINLFPQSLS